MALTLNGSTGISGIAGSAGTPALQGNNDANTGYFFAADTLGLSTAGSERLRIHSNGRVSIGTNSASGLLHLQDGDNTVLFLGNSSYDDGVIQYYNGSLNLKTGSSNGDRLFQVSTAGSERLRIDNNGKVLIATTTTSEAHANNDELIIGSSSDDANHGLTIVTPNDHYGTIAFSDGSGGNSQGLLEYNHAGDYMRIYTAAGERLRIDSSGLKIATTTNSGISGSADDLIIGSIGDSTDRGITLATTGLGSIRWADAGDNAMGRIQYSNALDFMSFHTSNAERFRIDSDGDLWFGLTPVTHHNNRHAFFHNASDNLISITAGSSATAGIVFGDSATNTTANYESYIAHYNVNDSLYLYTDQGNKGLELKKAGDVHVINGNLVVASGHGIDFSATADGPSQGNETLDDYERGTYSPQGLSWNGSSWVNVTFDSISRYGRYTKIGGYVHVQGYLSNFHVDSSFDNTLAGISLPFTPINTTGMYSVGVTTHSTAFSAAGYTTFFVNSTGSSHMYSMQENTTSYNTWSGSSGRYLMFQASYMCE